MQVSVFTPSHDPRYLADCYHRLRAQTHTDWEWVVLLNGGSRAWAPPVADSRVVVRRAAAGTRGVGAAKREACMLVSGDVLVELDHDDLLTPTCLADVRQALLDHPQASLAYSDCAQVLADLSPDPQRFGSGYGWEYTEDEIEGVRYQRCHSLAPTPHNVGYIWYAPNHVRAMRRTAYDEAGGYDSSLEVLDDQELMMRLFRVGDFHHIARCLYLQRMHERNTQIDPTTNAFIQNQTVAYYLQHVESLFTAWGARRGLATVTLVAGASHAGSIPDGCDTVVLDPHAPSLPFADNSVALVRAVEVLQRVPDRAALLNECHRVLVHGGMVKTETPSTDGRGAFQDPSHVAFYNENSFWYLTQAELRPSLPELTARFQVSHLSTSFPSDWHSKVNIPYVYANLLAVKDGPRQGGPLLC
jgi:glycosyltransferase involved in cell wall biosynthesis